MTNDPLCEGLLTEHPKDLMNQSSLFEAIGQGDIDQVKNLIQTRPTLLQERNERQATPLLWAVYTGQNGVRDVILDHQDNLDIWEAAAVGDHARVAAIIDGNPEQMNAPAPDGFPPLGLAAFFGHLDLMGWLLDQGADPNITATNPMQVRPIHSAAALRDEAKSLAAVQRLIDAGAAVNVAQHGGWTPLHQAAAHGAAALVDLLLAHGADREALSDDGRTPADMARESRFDEVAERLA